MRTHDELAALAAGYAIGALDADEQAVFADHVAGCASCAADVLAYSRVGEALGRSVMQVSPQPEARQRFLDAIDAPAVAADRMRPARAENPAMEREKSRRPPAWGLWGLQAATLLFAAALGLYAFSLRSRVATLEVRLDQAITMLATTDRSLTEARQAALSSQASMGVLAAPDLARIDLAGEAAAPAATARALWSRQRGMVFAVQNLPALPSGRIYQVWVVTADRPISAGLLEPDAAGGAIAYFQTPADIGAPVAIAVTIEPAGGAPAPTGDRYLIGTPS
jgi:anti-sigma-K factor RskA